MELCRLLPKCIVKFVGPWLMARSGAMQTVGRYVTKLVHERLVARDNDNDGKFLDCTQFIIKESRTDRQRSPIRLVQQMVALQFASAHQLPMALAWAIIMLCKHSEYIPLLRHELQQSELHSRKYQTKDLLLLDSFLRESSRLNPLDCLSVQRKAIQPFTFSTGEHIPAGNLVAVPQQAIMRDENNYCDPETFDPFRFYTTDLSTTEPVVKFTDSHCWKYPFWGSPSHSCPGRWYAADTMKHAIVHLLKNYDMELATSGPPKVMKWTTALAPSFGNRITLRARPDSDLCA
ncbi:hypothetical protein PG997_010216 [Apiospora hydei]|uniref:Cytochrome P450 n=1 Tax=Apiospora hydei TaxID=1337664 RepID=A0ABR1VWD1_9PEZI